MPGKENCIFCKIIKEDAPAEIFYQDEEVIIFKDIKPAAKCHFLAVPKEHIPNVRSLSSEHKILVEKLLSDVKKILQENGGNLDDVIYGFHVPPFNSIGHLHLHAISPTTDMSILSRCIFRNHSLWFKTVEQVLEDLSSKL